MTQLKIEGDWFGMAYGVKTPGQTPRQMRIEMSNFGTTITDKTGAQMAFDLFGGRVAAVVWSRDADEPAVCVKLDGKGRVTAVQVRKDLAGKIMT